ncbi:MAG TPA: hypothetical protein VNG31_02330, partial [Candidatus Baltobacteraceae bacterium]|nr:hypothetical protein [Candidatus Baltobacteraceae bacterium]
MNARRTDVVIVVVAALVIALLAYGRQSAARREPPSVFSTYDTGPNGYRALYAVLRGAGVAV